MPGWGLGWKTGESDRSPGAAEVVGVAEEVVRLHPAPEDGVPLPVEEAHAGPGGRRGEAEGFTGTKKNRRGGADPPPKPEGICGCVAGTQKREVSRNSL